MKRDIKFRVWSKSESKWIHPTQDITNMIYNPDWSIMQYTGLKDSEGKEIYEGDKITAGLYDSNGNQIIETVFFDEGCFKCDYHGDALGDLNLSMCSIVQDARGVGKKKKGAE